MLFFMVSAITVGAAKVQSAPVVVAVNENTKISFFFPSAITKVIEPAEQYTFIHTQGEDMGVLTGKKGGPSNLTIITADGNIYSFALNYQKYVTDLTYILSLEQAVGKVPVPGAAVGRAPSNISAAPEDATTNAASQPVRAGPRKEAPTKADSQEDTNDLVEHDGPLEKTDNEILSEQDFYSVDKIGYMTVFCENSYDQNPELKNIRASNSLITLRLNAIRADRTELYFILELENASWSDYRTESLHFFVKSRELRGKQEIEPLLIFNLKDTVPSKSRERLVFVCKDFQLATGQMVYVLLEENNGQRRVILPLKSGLINLK